NGLGAGSYTMTVTDANGCSATSIVNIITPNSPIISSSSFTDVTCNAGNDGSINVSASGGTGVINYNLQPLNQTNTTGSFTGLTAGSYTVTATDVLGCSVSTFMIISEPPSILWTNTFATNVNCFGNNDGSIQILASGGTGLINYLLQPGNSSNTSGIFNGLGPNTYTITATDQNNCSINTTIIVIEPPLLNWVTIIQNNVSCFGLSDASISISASGGTGSITYQIQPLNQSNTNGNFSSLLAGSYTLIATDANNCSISTTIMITEPTVLQISNVSHTNPTCVPGNDATITVTVSGGTLPYTYNLGSGNQTSNVFTNVGAGTYTIVVSDANNCIVTSIYNIAAPNAPVIASVNSTNIPCNGGSSGSILLNTSGGTGALSFNLQPLNQTNAIGSFTGLPAGNYTVTVTDVIGCSSTTSVQITEPLLLQWSSMLYADILCNGNSTGSITAIAVGGNGMITYNLQPGNLNNTTGIFQNLPANSYSITATDINACSISSVVILTEPPILLFDSITVQAALCNSAGNGMIDVTTVGGVGPIVFNINPAGTFTPPGNFSNLSGNTTYTIIAMDANGCSVSTSAFIAQPLSLLFTSTSATNISCNGAGDGSISVMATGGTGILNYNLQPGNLNNTTGSFSNLNGGAYTVTVVDANNCTISTVLMVSEPPLITLNSLTALDITCNNANDGSININCLGGTGSLNYNLQPTNINNATGVFANLMGATYTITVTDANFCTYSTSVIIINPTPISFDSVASTNVLCNGDSNGTVNVMAIGGTGLTYTYSILPLNQSNTSGQFVGLPANNYTVTAVDQNGCSISTLLVIVNPQPIVLSLNSKLDVSCFNGNNGSIQVSAVGGTQPYSYTIYPGMQTNATGIFNTLIAGTYTVVVTDSNACSDQIAGITIMQPTNLSINQLTHQDIICHGDSSGSIAITASGGTGILSYSISPANGTQNPVGYFNGLLSGLYTVTVTDANNCTLTTTVLISENPEIIIDEIEFTQPTCHGDQNGTMHVKASGGVGTLTYRLNSGNPLPTGVYVNLPAGAYLITVTDIYGCQKDSLFYLTEPDPVNVAELEISPILCAGASDGKIIVVGSGGNGGYTYSLKPGLHFSQNGYFAGLHQGMYTLTIRDSMGCHFDTILVINPPQNILNVTISKQDLSCFGAGIEGWAQANVNGGTPPFTFLWSTEPAQYTDRAVNLGFGYYFLEVTDVNGCQEKDSVYIEPGPCCEEVFIPNAFTPNGDGNNDEFKVTTSAGIELLKFAIYDRWGNRVWSTNNFRSGWDGTYRNENEHMNTFYWIFQYRCLTDGMIYIKKGDVILVR
ncbi:MAG: gliding motility-associated C-terminal domain-containing protein, partial [Chitinophagaceae bacterium]|nr:gliding motility-associated C-terminal domain-containing protein [Chitinophagaceae bacterium]